MDDKTSGKQGKKPQQVRDEHGDVHVLGKKLAEGGQGQVRYIQGSPRLLLKVSRHKDPDPKALAWRRQLERIRYMPIEDLMKGKK